MRNHLKRFASLLLVLAIILSAGTALAAEDYTEDEILLAKVMQLEGGSNYKSGWAVASVILNRLEAKNRWGYDTLSEVVYAKSQFYVVNRSDFDDYQPSATMLKAARMILAHGSLLPEGVESFRTADAGKGTKKSDGLYYWGKRVYGGTLYGNNYYFQNKSLALAWVESKKSGEDEPEEEEQVAAPVQAQEEQPDYITIQVAKGNTLSYLAKKYGTTVGAIQQLNDMAGTMIKTGQTLKIPQ